MVERAGGALGAEVLGDPSFALDVLTASEASDPTLVGRVLDYLRSRADGAMVVGSLSSPAAAVVTVATAVASYQAGPVAVMAKRTIYTYGTWIRRLVDAHDTRRLTSGDLQDLIALHVLKSRDEDERRLSGRTAESHGVTAYRHLWGYLVRKGWASENVAMELTKRPRPESRRRGIRPEEAILVRHLAIASSRDPLLDEVTLTVPERLGLRSIELLRLRPCDLVLDEKTLEVWGKVTRNVRCRCLGGWSTFWSGISTTGGQPG